MEVSILIRSLLGLAVASLQMKSPRSVCDLAGSSPHRAPRPATAPSVVPHSRAEGPRPTRAAQSGCGGRPRARCRAEAQSGGERAGAERGRGRGAPRRRHWGAATAQERAAAARAGQGPGHGAASRVLPQRPDGGRAGSAAPIPGPGTATVGRGTGAAAAPRFGSAAGGSGSGRLARPSVQSPPSRGERRRGSARADGRTGRRPPRRGRARQGTGEGGGREAAREGEREAASPLKAVRGRGPLPQGGCDWRGPASLRGRDIGAQQKAAAAFGRPRAWCGAGGTGARSQRCPRRSPAVLPPLRRAVFFSFFFFLRERSKAKPNSRFHVAAGLPVNIRPSAAGDAKDARARRRAAP